MIYFAIAAILLLMLSIVQFLIICIKELKSDGTGDIKKMMYIGFGALVFSLVMLMIAIAVEHSM